MTFRSAARLASRVHVEGGGVDEHGARRQLAELLQLLGGERRLRRPAPAEHGDLLDRRRGQRVEHVLGHVGRLELVGGAGQHPRDVERHVADADHDHRPDAGQRRLDAGPVGVGVPGVPGDELGGGEAAGQVLALDAEVPVEGGAVGVDDRVDVAAQLVEGDVDADVDVADEPDERVVEGPVQGVADGPHLRVVRGDAVAGPARRGSAAGRSGPRPPGRRPGG